MNHGKDICKALKQIRLDVARANGIDYNPTPCHHEGDCAGTCPACESEVRYIEHEIARKRGLGKAALVAGVSLGLAFSATSCRNQVQGEVDPVGRPLQGDVERVDTLENTVEDSIKTIDLDSVKAPVKDDEEMPLQGDIPDVKKEKCD